ncbi:MAG: SLC13 family permease [Pseudanabaena sp.]|nr:MAG: SLC13 family permease [Pseudanabaena sp.]
MNIDLIIVLLLLASAIAMFVINKPPMDAVALIMIAVLPFTGVITMGEALAGFSDPNIVLIAELFVIGHGLVSTGVAQRLGDWLISKTGSSELGLLVLLMLVVGGLGSVMSSTGVVAIFIPIVLRICQKNGTPPSQLMMPLSFTALISGMMTLVATAPNLVVNAELIRTGAKGFSFFSFTPFGVTILILGIIYMIFARRWLPSKNDQDVESDLRPRLRDWIEKYKLAEREYRVRLTEHSPLVGLTIEELDLRKSSGANIIAIERTRRFSNEIICPFAKTLLEPEDILLIDLFAPDVDIEALQQRLALEALPLTGDYFTDRSQEIGMVEVIVPANSQLIGKTLLESKFRKQYGLTVIGLRRGSTTVRRKLLNEVLKLGDTLLLIGSWKDIKRLQSDSTNLVILNLPVELDEVLPTAKRAPQALFSLTLVIVLMISGVIPNVQAALIGCLLMGAFGCIDLKSAYRSIHWQSIVLIVGMLPFSIALDRTGGIDLAADALIRLIGGAGIYTVLGSIFLITGVLGLFISNTATAVLMTPVALAIAQELNASPYPFAMIVALASSAAFMTPISSPVNTLVVGPGNYEFGDFVRIGVPFTLIVLVVSVFLVPLLLPPF